MTNETKKLLDITEFLSVLGHEFMLSTGYGVYAFLTHQTIYDFYMQYEASNITVQAFAKKIVKEHISR